MAVSVAQAFINIATGGPDAITATVGSGTSRILVFVNWDEDATTNIINPFRIGDQAFTGSFNWNHGTETTQMWLHYWDEAALDARSNSVITFTDTQNVSGYIYGTYEGVDQTTPLTELDQEEAENAAANLTLSGSSTSADYLLAIATRANGNVNRQVTDWDSLTEIDQLNPAAHQCMAGHGLGGDTDTLLQSATSDDWLAALMKVNALASGIVIPVPTGPWR